MVSQPHDLRAALLALEGVITGGALKDYAVLVSADERAAGSFD
jgi:hypothetical protein